MQYDNSINIIFIEENTLKIGNNVLPYKEHDI